MKNKLNTGNGIKNIKFKKDVRELKCFDSLPSFIQKKLLDNNN